MLLAVKDLELFSMRSSLFVFIFSGSQDCSTSVNARMYPLFNGTNRIC